MQTTTAEFWLAVLWVFVALQAGRMIGFRAGYKSGQELGFDAGMKVGAVQGYAIGQSQHKAGGMLAVEVGQKYPQAQKAIDAVEAEMAWYVALNELDP